MEPEWFTIAPVHALAKLYEKTNSKPRDWDLYEINEAFSGVTMAAAKEHGLDLETVNVHGGAVSLGHPIGCSGARVLVTLLHALEGSRQEARHRDALHRRRRGGRARGGARLMKTLGILGTGTMGAGIAQIAAQSGYSVLFWNRKAASVEKGVGAVKKGLGRLLQKESISQADHDAALARVRGVSALEDVKAADIVLEAVPEDLETKREIYEKLARDLRRGHHLRQQHLVALDHLAVGALGPALELRRHALLQSGAGDEAGRDRARARDVATRRPRP